MGFRGAGVTGQTVWVATLQRGRSPAFPGNAQSQNPDLHTPSGYYLEPEVPLTAS